jgi:ribonuclease HII
MGPLAGPVAGGAVILPVGVRLKGLNDSKQLSGLARERLDEQIRKRAMACSVHMVGPAQIDNLGLSAARNLACAGAVDGLGLRVDYLLCDAWDVPGIAVAQMAVIKGDTCCASIMAASIVAKVARDRLMIEYAKMYPGWGFERHKGYATSEHRLAINRQGASPIHRLSWSPFKDNVGEVE